MVFIPKAQPHAQSLFLFPIVFGINNIMEEPALPSRLWRSGDPAVVAKNGKLPKNQFELKSEAVQSQSSSYQIINH